MPLPLISCVCVTGKDDFHVKKLFPQAVRSFSEQNYPSERLELVVVHDNPRYRFGGDLVRIREVYAEGTLGELRNAGLDAAHGDLVIQWDDDDWHHPDRIVAQVGAYLGTGRPNCLYSQICYDWPTDTSYVRELPGNCLHGTILHENRPEYQYPGTEKGEDTAFMRHFPDLEVIRNKPELYVRFSHGHNTWDRSHIMRGHSGAPTGTWDLTSPGRDYLRAVLGYYPIARSSSSETRQSAPRLRISS